MYRGRHSLGEEITLSVLCKSGLAPTAPDACPAVSVYSSSGKVIGGKLIPIREKGVVSGHFSYNLFLGDAYSAGSYSVTYRYLISGALKAEVDTFEVLAGGDPSGSVIAQHFYERPHATFVVQERDGGRIYKGKNPRLS